MRISDCPMCGAENGPMGTLGTRVHYSCRDCGAQWSHVAPEELSEELSDDDEETDDDPNACADCERSNGPGSRCTCADYQGESDDV
jgi:DNA-directed RNA polymerase subunit RPC12/RpoP